MKWKRKPDHVRISGTPRGAGTLRTDVRTRTRAAGGFARPANQCIGTGGPARSVLHEPAKSDGSRDGFADDQPGAGSCQGTGTIGDGRAAASETKVTRLKERHLFSRVRTAASTLFNEDSAKSGEFSSSSKNSNRVAKMGSAGARFQSW